METATSKLGAPVACNRNDEVPAGTDVGKVIVMMLDVTPVVSTAGLNEMITVAGTCSAASVTSPVKVPTRVIRTDAVFDPPMGAENVLEPTGFRTTLKPNPLLVSSPFVVLAALQPAMTNGANSERASVRKIRDKVCS